jgi:hypothetical protein
MSKRAIVAAAVVALLGSAANGVETVDETFDETYTLDRDGAISIKNTDGSIRIYAADVNEVHVHALKRAYTAERVNAIEIVADATRKTLSIDTRYPPKSGALFADKSGTVDYTLIVPMRANIAACDLSAGEILVEGLQEGSAKAHLVNGWLSAHNCFVDVDVSIVNGKLDLAYDWWRDGKSFSANGTSVNGTVRALIPPDGSLAISAASQNGKIANNFDDSDSNAVANTSSIETVIGAGKSATMSLRSSNGNIRIDKSY